MTSDREAKKKSPPASMPAMLETVGNVLIVRIHGELDALALQELGDNILRDDGNTQVRLLVDFGKTDTSTLTPEEIASVVAHDATYENAERIACALVVAGESQLHFADVFQSMSAEDPALIQVFTQESDALAWLQAI